MLGEKAHPALELFSDCGAPALARDDNDTSRDATITWQAKQTGKLYLRVTNTTASPLVAGAPYQLAVREEETQPVALVVVGQVTDSGQQAALNATGDLAYRTFLSTGLPKAHLRYYRPDASIDLDGNGSADDVAGLPKVNDVRQSIQDWSRDEGVSLGVPFYLVLIGSGSADQVSIEGSGKGINPADLALWLSNLETTSGADKINVILESPQSGSFIDVTPASPDTISGRNRVIITSTSASQNSYLAPDGAYFTSALFRALGQKKSLADAFTDARQTVLDLGLLQDPQIDVDGAALASAAAPQGLSLNTSSPSLVESIAAGRGLNVVGNSLPPVIDSAACTVSGGKCTQVLAHIRDDEDVTSAWVEVYPATGSPTDPVVVAVQKIHMTSSDQLAFTAVNLSLATNVKVFVIAEDAQGNRSEHFQVSGPGKVKLFLPVLKK